jgi:hypothetical protein
VISAGQSAFFFNGLLEVAAASPIILDRDFDVYLMEIDGPQHNWSISLSLLVEELTRCSLLNYFAQPDK